MANQIPNCYFDNLENYEDFLLRKTLLGFELTKIHLSDDFYHLYNKDIWCLSTHEGFVYINEMCAKITFDECGCSFNYAGYHHKLRCNSLIGAPKIVYGHFSCSSQDNLTSLKGAPQKVGNEFCCAYCKNLTSLKGAPQEVGGNFNCSRCDSLTSLKGAPQKVLRDFKCCNCKNLTSLKGAPIEIWGNFECENNPKLTVKQINDYLEFLKNPTPEHIDETGHYKP